MKGTLHNVIPAESNAVILQARCSKITCLNRHFANNISVTAGDSLMSRANGKEYVFAARGSLESFSYTATTVGDGEVVWCWEGTGSGRRKEKGQMRGHEVSRR